ncbi:MAG: hypothetical protein MI920_37035 [Kiloniellales bacterium]|nr:hypothetical protein [Kiloniellales bacterium]
MSARGLAFTIFLLVTAAHAHGASAEGRTLRHIVYDYAVTSYCGLLSPEVEQGFQRELAAETARNGLDAEAAKAQRIAGWVDADREWSNRGLGGFKAWCASDGADAAARFLAVAREAR